MKAFKAYVEQFNTLFLSEMQGENFFLFASSYIPLPSFYLERRERKILQASNLILATLYYSQNKTNMYYLAKDIITQPRSIKDNSKQLICISFHKTTYNKFYTLYPESCFVSAESIPRWSSPFTKRFNIVERPIRPISFFYSDRTTKFLTLLFAHYFNCCFTQTLYTPFFLPSQFREEIKEKVKTDYQFIVKCCNDGFRIFVGDAPEEYSPHIEMVNNDSTAEIMVQRILKGVI